MRFTPIPERTQTVIFNRPATVRRDGLERAAPGTGAVLPVNAPVVGELELVTEEVRRARPGTSASLAFKFRTADLTTPFARLDRVTATWPYPGGQRVELFVDQVDVRGLLRYRQALFVDHLDQPGIR